MSFYMPLDGSLTKTLPNGQLCFIFDSRCRLR